MATIVGTWQISFSSKQYAFNVILYEFNWSVSGISYTLILSPFDECIKYRYYITWWCSDVLKYTFRSLQMIDIVKPIAPKNGRGVDTDFLYDEEWWIRARLWSPRCQHTGNTPALHYALDWQSRFLLSLQRSNYFHSITRQSWQYYRPVGPPCHQDQ